jgi:PAS domain S-box-containing protein
VPAQNGIPHEDPVAPNAGTSCAANPAETAALTVEQLRIALEGLRVSEEELRAQNEELAEARHDLEMERARYQALFEFAPDAYLVTTPEGGIREANRAAAELLRVRHGYLVGKPIAVFFARDDRRLFREQLHRLQGELTRLAWEVRMVRRGGETFDAHLTIGAERDSGTGQARLLWLVRDVTAAKQEERLAALGQMVAGLAHESRNALQRSEACLERLRWRLHEQPESLDLVRRVQNAHDDLRRLFADVSHYVRPQRLDLEVYDLPEVWRQAWAELALRREGRDAALEEDTGDLDLSCVCDPFRLRQVFLNIFDNALAACADPVWIVIRCEQVPLGGRRAVRVMVRDSGPGLDAEQRHKIFDPFYTTKTRGTGLGMAIAKRIVEAHKGDIRVGDGLRPGAEIVITLPMRPS